MLLSPSSLVPLDRLVLSIPRKESATSRQIQVEWHNSEPGGKMQAYLMLSYEDTVLFKRNTLGSFRNIGLPPLACGNGGCATRLSGAVFLPVHNREENNSPLKNK